MSTNKDKLIARVGQLQKFAELIVKELGEIRHELEEEKRMQAISPVSTSAEEMAIMEQQVAVKKARDEKLTPFIGAESQLIKYLSPSAIRGGKGFIKETESFRQYEESLMSAPIDSVINWPSGFYRSELTGDVQLLLKSDEFALVFEGLPADNGKVSVIRFMDEEPQLTDLKDIDDSELVRLEGMLITVLESVMDAHGF